MTAYEAQAKFCREHDVLILVPIHGSCFRCGRDIWVKITPEEAGERYITGCPYCGRSWCE